MSNPPEDHPPLVDLASKRLGGRIECVTDDFFAPASCMLEEGRGEFIAGKFTDRGKWMDGWETRRRRDDGHDWCVIGLGACGRIHALTVDTNHFRGNQPSACSLEMCSITGLDGAQSLDDWRRAPWHEALPRSPLGPSEEHRFQLSPTERISHVRLHIYPDGGVARLRVWGEVEPDWRALCAPGEPIDLAATVHGGVALAANDESFGPARKLLMPGRGVNMGDGWETRRRREPGHDWAIIRLGRRGRIEEIEVDTCHFKGNFPESCAVDGIDDTDLSPRQQGEANGSWMPIVAQTPLSADAIHRFKNDLSARGPFTHLRLRIFPDGGVSRLRVRGVPQEEA